MRQRYFELLRQQTPAGKLRSVVQLTAGMRRFVLAGIRERYPDASASEQRQLLARRLYGDLGASVFR